MMLMTSVRATGKQRETAFMFKHFGSSCDKNLEIKILQI